jgi:hypothetical protein
MGLILQILVIFYILNKQQYLKNLYKCSKASDHPWQNEYSGTNMHQY